MRKELVDLLRANRCKQRTGSGDPYWYSQVDVFEAFMDKHFIDESKTG